MSLKKKESLVSVRLPPDARRRFMGKSAEFGGMSHVLREMILAFIEDRITINPPSLKGTIYHVD